MSTLIFLHGASSSGKSTLAKSIRAHSDNPFIHVSWDTFRDSGAIEPQAYPNWPEARHRIFDGVHRSFAAFADAGCDLIIEHILDTDGWHAQLQDLLRAHEVLFVGVFVPEAVLVQREQARANRQIGSAVEDARKIHLKLRYDLEIDATKDPASNARRVLQSLTAVPQRRSRFFDTIV